MKQKKSKAAMFKSLLQKVKLTSQKRLFFFFFIYFYFSTYINLHNIQTQKTKVVYRKEK